MFNKNRIENERQQIQTVGMYKYKQNAAPNEKTIDKNMNGWEFKTNLNLKSMKVKLQLGGYLKMNSIKLLNATDLSMDQRLYT